MHSSSVILMRRPVARRGSLGAGLRASSVRGAQRQIIRRSGSGLLQCRRCRYQTSLIAGVVNWRFDRLQRMRSAFCRCRRRSTERSWPHNHRESGECRFMRLSNKWSVAVNLESSVVKMVADTLKGVIEKIG